MRLARMFRSRSSAEHPQLNLRAGSETDLRFHAYLPVHAHSDEEAFIKQFLAEAEGKDADRKV
jgi:hypothetical protein